MSYAVDFVNVSTVGLESSPVAAALAGLRANEARYFKNKYDHVFTVSRPPRPRRPSTGCTGSSRRSATSSSYRAHSRQRPSRSRTSGGPMSSTRAGSRSTCCSTNRRSERSGSSSPKGWRSPPARLIQVRPTEVEAGRDHPRLVFLDQGRLLTPAGTAVDGHSDPSSGGGVRRSPDLGVVVVNGREGQWCRPRSHRAAGRRGSDTPAIAACRTRSHRESVVW